FRVGYIGKIIADKGVDIRLKAMIEILDQRHDIILYIAGDLKYDTIFSQKLFKSREECKHKNHVIFLNEFDDVDTFFLNIDVRCVPSVRQEPLGNIIVEAKQNQTPSIIFNSGGMPELIKH